LVQRLKRSNKPDHVRLADKLSDPVTLEFVATALNDIANFLKDYTRENVLLLHTRLTDNHPVNDPLESKPVSVRLQSVSLTTAFNCLTDEADIDWDVVDGVLVLGTPDATAAFRHRVEGTDRKLARLEESVAKSLHEPIVVARGEAHLIKPNESWSILAKRIEPGEYSRKAILDYFRVTFDATVPSDFDEPLVYLSATELPLSRGLDILCESSGLEWEAQDDGTIRILKSAGER